MRATESVAWMCRAVFQIASSYSCLTTRRAIPPLLSEVAGVVVGLSMLKPRAQGIKVPPVTIGAWRIVPRAGGVGGGHGVMVFLAAQISGPNSSLLQG